MSQGVPYSATQQDLFYPAKTLDTFPTQRPKTDAELCVWMSLLAYCDQYPDFAFDQARIKQKLAPLGFRPLEPLGFFESKGHDRNGGTHCFIAVDDTVKVNKLAVVAFRGTDKDDPTDALDDREAKLVPWSGTAKVFQGWRDALDEVQQDLLPAVQKIDCRLLITGHSLGAALATVLATLKTPSALYTFGSPRVGDHDFVALLSGVENSRYVDCCDIVTTLPPELLGYAHVGDPLYIDRHRKVIRNPGDQFISADRSAAATAYFFRYSWKWGTVWVRNLADHAPINYVTAIRAAQP